jgi:hypothetical protein
VDCGEGWIPTWFIAFPSGQAGSSLSFSYSTFHPVPFTLYLEQKNNRNNRNPFKTFKAEEILYPVVEKA